MGNVHVTILDSTGQVERKADLPDDVIVKWIINRVTTMIGLPKTTSKGEPIYYTFHNKSSGEYISETQTLAEAGVNDGDILCLMPDLTSLLREVELSGSNIFGIIISRLHPPFPDEYQHAEDIIAFIEVFKHLLALSQLSRWLISFPCRYSLPINPLIAAKRFYVSNDGEIDFIALILMELYGCGIPIGELQDILIKDLLCFITYSQDLKELIRKYKFALTRFDKSCNKLIRVKWLNNNDVLAHAGHSGEWFISNNYILVFAE